jgi:hypothetical protein
VFRVWALLSPPGDRVSGKRGVLNSTPNRVPEQGGSGQWEQVIFAGCEPFAKWLINDRRQRRPAAGGRCTPLLDRDFMASLLQWTW